MRKARKSVGLQSSSLRFPFNQSCCGAGWGGGLQAFPPLGACPRTCHRDRCLQARRSRPAQRDAEAPAAAHAAPAVGPRRGRGWGHPETVAAASRCCRRPRRSPSGHSSFRGRLRRSLPAVLPPRTWAASGRGLGPHLAGEDRRRGRGRGLGAAGRAPLASNFLLKRAF